MASPLPFPFPQPPEWLVSELQRRLLLAFNHVLMQEAGAQARLARQAGTALAARLRGKGIAGRRSAMRRYVRAVFILWVVLRYGLDELVLTSFRRPVLSRLARVLSFGRDLRAPRGQRLRQAFEHLGPIFVKF